MKLLHIELGCAVACGLVLAGTIGCSPKSERPSGVANPVWSSDQLGKDKIPGIDQASITCGLWGSRGMAVVVWTDLPGGSSEFLPPVTTKTEGFVFVGHHRSSDGRQVECRIATRDGSTGPVTINGKSFNLAQGALFLVSTTGAQTQVRQLKRDFVKLEPGDLMHLAKNDQEIRTFFTNVHKKTKP